MLIFYNIDPPGTGVFENFELVRMSPSGPQAEVQYSEETNGYSCLINTEHSSYKNYRGIENDLIFSTYFNDLFIRQALLVCIKTNHLSIFEGLRTFDNLSTDEVNNIINEKHGALLSVLLESQ